MPVNITTLPPQILRKIFKFVRQDHLEGVWSWGGIQREPVTFFALSYVNKQFQTICLDLYFNIDSSILPSQERKHKLYKMQDVEAEFTAYKSGIISPPKMRSKHPHQIAHIFAEKFPGDKEDYNRAKRAAESVYEIIREVWGEQT
ncbi:hypothetical protein PMZ80_002996 [Knufia obscura]|uniref:F-box domain-containing protein n=1 Tax=Knufia obscura TaxID=1635080 RepID=A0ABR0RZU5_9EURO|nr:hypothetical protein PMZ80_002996 [Knufia obscura]